MPKKRVTKRQIQVPFREKDLLPVDTFIRYCEGYGIKTDRDELEYFEKEGLFLPAVRVLQGVCEHKKVLANFDGKEEWRYVWKPDMRKVRSKYKVKRVERPTYYKYGVLSMGQPGWLKQCGELGLVRYPARQKFRPWSYYQIKEYDYTADLRLLEHAAETLYSRHQMYFLRLIRPMRRLVVRHDGLFDSPEGWIRRGERVRKVFDREKTTDLIRQMVWRHNRFFGLLVDIENLWEQYQRDLYAELRSEVQAQVGEGRGDPTDIADEVLRDWQSAASPLDEHLMPAAERLLKKHGFSRSEVEGWRFAFLGYGTLSLKRPLVKEYLMKLDDDVLMNAEDPYRLYGLINWFIRLCGGTYVGIKEAIMRFPGRFCPYCGGPIPKPKKNQVSCGRDECKREHRLKLQRDGYRSGEYG